MIHDYSIYKSFCLVLPMSSLHSRRHLHYNNDTNTV